MTLATRASARNALPDFVDLSTASGDTTAEILAGLNATPRCINPKFFYDSHGSALFERITALPEYYPTRTERGILKAFSRQIAQATGTRRVLIEPGAGSCEKVRLLLPTMQPAAYVPTDIAGDFLHASAEKLRSEFPWLPVTAIQADFTALTAMPESLPAGPRCLFYPGSTLGNFQRDEAQAFLCQAATLIGAGGTLLIGIDLHKETATLEAAYNDSAGITADFNLNILRHLNQLLPANFDLRAFRHVAHYNEAEKRIEMHLESRKAQQVDCADITITLDAGERLLTEYSCKYTRDDFALLADAAGLTVRHCWQDPAGMFAVFCLAPSGT
ncbi:L-histidine N(alpha)-methyltransferase [Alcanivorax sp. JB21]|uniref:L-histidine N(alpha)-methyltransferase n=1 Tax=Alcanivorax limicola TaxID=2874102 RepID=UPI001CBC1F1D|nr:L-histidine N(alpha)-methyltransferase [Alcanivorax limicola]MBZ2188354.1 L-histidine N(alpha)-methyltransferase [Alcanivorax limicola]